MTLSRRIPRSLTSGTALTIIASGVVGSQTGQRIGATPDSSPSVAWYSSYLKDSRLVRLPNGRTLNLYCMGSGSPTVVLESGLGGYAFDWRLVQGRIATQTRVCAYDRAGMGKSPSGPPPRDTRAQVSDLESLLTAAGIQGPYVLVGHSMGGYNVRLFASRHLADVAGIVLVDPSVENQISVLEAAVPEIAQQDKISVSRARACADSQRTAQVAGFCTRPAPDEFPEELAKAFRASQSLAQSQTYLSEIESFLAVDSDQVVAERRAFGAIPLVILTRSERSTNMPPEAAATEWRLWNQMHDDVAKLSTKGVNRVVNGAGHYVQLDRPAAVVDAVVEVVKASRSPR